MAWSLLGLQAGKIEGLECVEGLECGDFRGLGFRGLGV